ncbi:MAG: Na+/H+ antiporter NhaA [Gammaproteobacteria bacterium]|nr:MAG: Na+/H+ antiporter NhaA [Gammaproteobacteria bacterium]
MIKALRDKWGDEAATGILLMLAAMAALLAANTPLAYWYNLLLDLPVTVRVGPVEIDKPLLLWINDGLMAVFFFHVGLELKKEVVSGHLTHMQTAALPVVGAIGGVLVPALVYISIANDAPEHGKGWAIPTATDIAFAIGLLALLGDRVPPGLRIFLLTLAIVDDLMAIIIIALFYTDHLSATALLISAACCYLLWRLNKTGKGEIAPFILVGIVMWVSLLKSGVHATLAGVILALFIPMRAKTESGKVIRPLNRIFHDLEASVRFTILPVFAFANAGVVIGNMGLDSLLHPVPMGIALGLFLGKPIGIFLLCRLSALVGIGKLPKGVNWTMLLAVGIIAGIGFTMSLFISSLAFNTDSVARHFDERLGILIGSTLSGIVGFLLLRYTLNRTASDSQTSLQPDGPDR